jgi:hypothetical protein
MKRYDLICVCLMVFVTVFAIPAFAQESQDTSKAEAEAPAPVAAAVEQTQAETVGATEKTAQEAAGTMSSAAEEATKAVETAPAAPMAPVAPMAAAAPVAPAAGEAKEVAIYGEVQAVNAASGTMTVQYYDYDSDEEKTIELTMDSTTKLENAANLNEVKKGDWVDATYEASAGKNMARSVMVEKEEYSAPEAGAGAASPAEPATE